MATLKKTVVPGISGIKNLTRWAEHPTCTAHGPKSLSQALWYDGGPARESRLLAELLAR